MRLAVSATRMELQRLKRRLAIARRGHKLLKDKQDELMRQFMQLVQEVRALRRTVEENLQAAFRSFTLASAAMSEPALEEALALPSKRFELAVGERAIMNVRVPVYTPSVSGSMRCYGFATTTGDLDASLLAIEKVVAQAVELAQAEKTMDLLADEIDRTRRRVNALEYNLIPTLEETIRGIGAKLAEFERSNLTRIMKIKDMLEAQRGSE